MRFENSLVFAQQLDATDPLNNFRKQFIIPERNSTQQIYFLGNSLGLQPVNTETALKETLQQWAAYGVEGFFEGNDPWLKYHAKLVQPLATIVGSLPSEIVVMNQLTVNLHLMMISFYRPNGKRRKILCEAKAFPSDQYMLETHVKHYGFNPDEVIVEVSPREGEHTICHEDILNAIERHKDELALVQWGGINYYTGQLFDIEKITKAAHEAGAVAGFDLAHAAGNVPLQLHEWEVDFACWCSYKYLNSGPGAIGAVYIHEKHQHDTTLPRFAGWWGYEASTRFNMDKGFKPAAGAEGWQLSTPSILLYAAHKASLDIFESAGWERIQEKRKRLSAYLWFLLDTINEDLSENNITIITPRKEADHGCQVSMLMLKDGRKVFDELTKAGVMVDWREPGVIRIAPVPLYNTYEEVWRFANTLGKIMKSF